MRDNYKDDEEEDENEIENREVSDQVVEESRRRRRCLFLDDDDGDEPGEDNAMNVEIMGKRKNLLDLADEEEARWNQRKAQLGHEKGKCEEGGCGADDKG